MHPVTIPIRRADESMTTLRTELSPQEASGGKHRRLLGVGASVLWLAGIAAGMGVLFDYDATPGGAGDPPATWPEDSTIERPHDGPVLVVFAHPRCPCTRATLYELERLRARCPTLCTQVVFCVPDAAPADWCQGELWRQAAAIPGVRLYRDEGCREIHRFRAVTSGQAVLYDGGGALTFTGGITASRGHAGDNAGVDAIVSLTAGAVPAVRRTGVYGCALEGRTREPGEVAWR